MDVAAGEAGGAVAEVKEVVETAVDAVLAVDRQLYNYCKWMKDRHDTMFLYSSFALR